MKNNLLVIGLLFLSINLIFWPEKNKNNNIVRANLNESFTVKVIGEVNMPKEFILYNPIKVQDLINYCLDFTKEADYSSINLNEVINENTIIEVKTKTNNIQTTIYDLNLVTYEELITITHIGDKTALNIIQYRNDIGGYKSVEELLKVKLIGTQTFEKIKAYFRV